MTAKNDKGHVPVLQPYIEYVQPKRDRFGIGQCGKARKIVPQGMERTIDSFDIVATGAADDEGKRCEPSLPGAPRAPILRAEPMMRFLKAAAIGTGVLLLVFVITVVAPSGVLDALGRVPTAHVLAALAVVQVQIILSALRWRFTAARLGHPIPAPVAIREYYMGGFLNQILPGGIAGDAARVYRSSDDSSGGWKRAATSVVLERLSGQFAFFMLTCLGLLAWPVLLPQAMPVWSSLPIWVAAAVIAAFAAVGALLRAPLKAWLVRLLPDLAAAFWRNGAFAVQAGLSILIVGSYVATFLLASDAVGATLPPIAAVTVIPLCLLSMLVPLGIGGWGTREAAAAALWPLFGFTGAEGLAASLLYGVFTLAGTALPGLIVLSGSLLGGFRHGR